jgi:hypothetical protein
MHNIGLESMHENWIRSMHENVNEYADDLNKLFFKQTVSQDLSISKSAHTYICFKHMAWTLKTATSLQLCTVSAVKGKFGGWGGGDTMRWTFHFFYLSCFR